MLRLTGPPSRTAVRYFKCKRHSWSAGYGNGWFLRDDCRVPESAVGSSLQFCTTSASDPRGLFYSIEAAFVLRFWQSCFIYSPATAPDGRRSALPPFRPISEERHIFFDCPDINRVSANGSLLESVPMSLFVPILMVSERSVLSRRVRQGKVFAARPTAVPVSPPAPPPHE